MSVSMENRCAYSRCDAWIELNLENMGGSHHLSAPGTVIPAIAENYSLIRIGIFLLMNGGHT